MLGAPGRAWASPSSTPPCPDELRDRACADGGCPGACADEDRGDAKKIVVDATGLVGGVLLLGGTIAAASAGLLTVGAHAQSYQRTGRLADEYEAATDERQRTVLLAQAREQQQTQERLARDWSSWGAWVFWTGALAAGLGVVGVTAATLLRAPPQEAPPEAPLAAPTGAARDEAAP